MTEKVNPDLERKYNQLLDSYVEKYIKPQHEHLSNKSSENSEDSDSEKDHSRPSSSRVEIIKPRPKSSGSSMIPLFQLLSKPSVTSYFDAIDIVTVKNSSKVTFELSECPKENVGNKYLLDDVYADLKSYEENIEKKNFIRDIFLSSISSQEKEQDIEASCEIFN